jgi:Plasmid pRiA4b ORF-3-like protein
VAKSRALYQLKVTLRDIHPPIWRRIQVWEDTTLAQLHTILQIVMGWEDYHLHEFVIGRRLYSVPDPDDIMYERNVVDESHLPLEDVVPRVGTEFAYLYDFGDSWEHDLILEAVLLPETTAQYPTCIGGERRTPPEDVGGIPGYEEYLAVLADPEHEEHGNMLQWRGPFHPESFAPDQVNQRLRKKFRSRKMAKSSSLAQK